MSIGTRLLWELMGTELILKVGVTTQKVRFSINYFFSICDEIRKLQIWLHLLRISLIENLFFVQR